MKAGEYYASRAWAVLREQVRKRAGDRCERCGRGKHEQTHHLTYERFGHEKLEDLLAVCAACHEFLSAKRDDDPAHTDVRLERAAEILALVQARALLYHAADLHQQSCGNDLFAQNLRKLAGMHGFYAQSLLAEVRQHVDAA